MGDSGMRALRFLLWGALAVAAGGVLLGVVPAAYLFGPIGGLFIYRFGIATLGGLRRGASHVPDGPPEPVDLDSERVTYWCEGCGAELLLLVRGTASPPRHCGERMSERRETPPPDPLDRTLAPDPLDRTPDRSDLDLF